MNIKKIHLKGETIHMEWTKTTMKPDDKSATNKYSMTESELAVPGFYTAVQSLAADVCAICQLPDNYTEGMKIVGLTLSYGEDEQWGALISAVKTLKNSNAPFNIHTPFKWAIASDPSVESSFLSKGCVKRLELVLDYAEGYIDGDRAQGKLFDDKEDEEKKMRDPDVRVSKRAGQSN